MPAAALLRLTVLAVLVAAAPLEAADVPTAPEPYFSHPDMASVQLSPSGKRIAALAPVDGRVQLLVMETDKREPRALTRMEVSDVAWFAWVNDDRIVLSFVDLQSGSAEQHRRRGLYAVDHDGKDARSISGRFHSALSDGSDDIIVPGNWRTAEHPDVYRLNTRTNETTILSWDRPGDPTRWVVDRNGRARAVVTVEKGTLQRSWWRTDGEAKWQLIGEYPIARGAVLPVAFDGDGSLIVASGVGRNTAALYRFDTTKNAPGELLAAHPHFDLTGGLIFDPVKQRIVGVAYNGAKPGQVWFDDDWARLSAAIDAALPGRYNAISRGHAQRVLVTTMSDRDPGSWYLYDVGARKLEYLAQHRKTIDPAAMPQREPIRYKARDGLEIPAYLTLPPQREGRALPLVLYVHGGPFVRGSSWTWQAVPAWLAAQGYAVLEPEFRGSAGWGGALFHGGWRQWGRGMQDDLIDGIDFLAGRGTIDARRVCIMGASYGGYAVMMGLARDPERFRCGVNYLGVTDITMLFDVTWSDNWNSDYMKYSAKLMIGDPERDAERLREVSPLANAAKIRAPVLMAYGSQDRRVPLVHGERMRDALRAQGTDVEWVTYADEGHGFLRESNRYDFYARVQRFLVRHLGK